MNCLVSVVIPMYNASAYINKTIESVINQTYKNIEIIVVDNCSTDNSVEIVRSLNSDKIKLYENEKNLGFTGNVNRGIEYAQGDYIKFLCADDELKENCIEELIKLFNDETSAIYCNCDYIDSNENIIVDKAASKKSFIVKNQRNDLKKLIVKKDSILCCISFLMVKNGFKARFEDIDNSSYNSDLVFMFDLIKEFGSISYVNKKMICLRRHSDQGTYKSKGNEIFRLPLLFNKKILENCNLKLSKYEMFKYRFNVFKNGANAFYKYQHKMPKDVKKYTYKEFGRRYYLLLFCIYLPFVYIPKKLILKIASIFKR